MPVHGCAGGLATDIEVQAPIGFNRRKATARIAKPNFVVAFMVPFAKSSVHVTNQ